MAENEKKIRIEIYRKKDAEELSAALADPAGRLELGSAAALAGANACAMVLRGTRVAAAGREEEERFVYLLRNIEKLRSYLVYLIDEDVKGQNIYRRAVKEGDARKIDAARQPACAISDEVISEMDHLIDFLDELSETATAKSAIYFGAALEMALSAIRSARLFVVSMSAQSSDDTYAFVVRRENEIREEERSPKTERIRARVEQALSAASE